MPGDAVTPLDDVVRRNIATLRAKSNLSQQGLAEEMLHRGIGWTRETVGLVETTQRRLSFTEALAVAASLDVPLARLVATATTTVAVGEAEWSAAYLTAAVAGSAGDVFPPESYATPRRTMPSSPAPDMPAAPSVSGPPSSPGPPADRAPATEVVTPASPPSAPRDEPVVWPPLAAGRPDAMGRPAAGVTGVTGEAAATGMTGEAGEAPQVADRIERRMRQRITPGEVSDTAHRLWSRDLEIERERRVRDRQALTGGTEQAARSAVARDIDRELEYELRRIRGEQAAPGGAETPIPPGEVPGRAGDAERDPARVTSDWSRTAPGAPAPAPVTPVTPVTPDEVSWEVTRLNILLANKGYADSDVARWWHTTRHRELGGLTVAEAWDDGAYVAVARLVQALPDKLVALDDA